MTVTELRCCHCTLPLREPRSYVHTIDRAIYHQHCAHALTPSRADIVAVPLAVAHTLVRASRPWRLLECGIRVAWRDAWWGVFWDRSGVRLTLYVCFLPFLPLRVVVGPRLREACRRAPHAVERSP